MYDRHLDAFLLVAELGSFSKAAERLYISPNAIIKQINLLESDLGLTLFYRTTHGVKLTAAGEIILKEAKHIVHLSELAIEKAKKKEDSERKTIRIGTSLLRPCKTIMDMWAGISDNYPDIELEIVPFDDVSYEWLNVLTSKEHKVDVIAGIYPSTIEDRHVKVLKTNDVPLCLAVSRKNPLSEKKKLTLKDLYGETLLMVERGDTSFIDAIRDEIEERHPQIKVQDVPAYDTKTFNLCDSTRSIMITIATWADLHPSLVTIPCRWDYTVPYGILYSESPSDSAKIFLDAITEHI